MSCHVCRYDEFGRLKKEFRTGMDRSEREAAALQRLHGTVGGPRSIVIEGEPTQPPQQQQQQVREKRLEDGERADTGSGKEGGSKEKEREREREKGREREREKEKDRERGSSRGRERDRERADRDSGRRSDSQRDRKDSGRDRCVDRRAV